MSSHSTAKFLILPAALAMALGAQGAAQAATTPAVKCAQAVAKTVAKCTKKAVSTYASCYKSTGAPCADNNEKLLNGASSAAKAIRSKCESTAAVADAGYGPYTAPALGTHFGDVCTWQARVIAGRAFGTDGSLWTAADADGRKCLSTAAKEAGKYLSSALGVIGKCVGSDCVPAETTAAIAALSTSTSTLIGSKCPTFAAIAGTSPEGFVAATTEQLASAVASPCDPIDPTRCAFPFPNDHFAIAGANTPSGRQLAMGRAIMPKNSIEKPVATARWNTGDGFSVGPMLLMNDVNIDLTMTGVAPITDMAQSLDADAPVVLIDAVTGEKQLLWVERDLRGSTIADQPIIIRVGRNLKDGHRYIVAMRNMKNTAGTVLSAPAGFAIYRDNTPTELLPVEMRRDHMESLFTTLTGFGIARNELYLAWDFTTQSSDSTAGKLLAMRDNAFDDILGSDAPAFTVDEVIEPLDGSIFRQVSGTFQVPLYLTDDGVPGASLRLDAFGVPENLGDFFTADYSCLIPYAATTGGAAPVIPARPSLYGHGLLGSHEEVDAGNVRAMSNEHNMVFCATDWTGFAEEDAGFVILSVLRDFSVFPDFIDRQHQGVLNFMFLGRLLIHPDGFASDPNFQVGGTSVIDPASDLFYDGNSQGGILGGVLGAFSQDATRFSLGVPGMNYSTLLNRSIDFTDFDDLLTDNYSSSTDRNLLLSLAQTTWDRTDPSGHINHLLSDPYAGTPAKKALYQVAFGDHQVAPLTVEVAARTNGMSIHQPTLSMGKVVPDVTPYYDIPGIPAYPFDGSAMVIWDSGNPAPPLGNVPPPEITPMDSEWADLGPCPRGRNSDPHSCPRSNANARIQKSEFLKNNGMVVDVCGGAACLAP